MDEGSMDCKEWLAERDALFAEQEADLKEADARGKPLWPPVSEADYLQMLYQEWQERHGIGE